MVLKVLLQDHLASCFKAGKSRASEREEAVMVATSHPKKQGREEKPGARNHTLKRHTPPPPHDPTSSSSVHSAVLRCASPLMRLTPLWSHPFSTHPWAGDQHEGMAWLPVRLWPCSAIHKLVSFLYSSGYPSENPHALTVSPFKAFSPQPPKFFKPLMPVKEEHKKRIALEARPLLSQEVNAWLLCPVPNWTERCCLQ